MNNSLLNNPPLGVLAAVLKRIDVSRQSSLVSTHLSPLTHQGSRITTGLIGASKSQPASAIEALIAEGLMDFGENKVQEAAAKWPAIKAAYPSVRLHLIGPLQSNKAEDAVALFDTIQTVDRPKIATAIASQMVKQGRRPRLLIQVNIGDEPQKAGVSVVEVPLLLDHCRALGLTIDGLMAVPPEGKNSAPYFALLKKLADYHALAELSMGMSSDFEIAVRLGATMVRLGTTLFGSRAVAISSFSSPAVL